MGLFAVFGITNDGLNLAVNLLLLFLVVLWLALVYWTYADARRRIDDPLLVGCATGASLFPFVGTIVYTIVRPSTWRTGASVSWRSRPPRRGWRAWSSSRAPTARTRSRPRSCAAPTAC